MMRVKGTPANTILQGKVEGEKITKMASVLDDAKEWTELSSLFIVRSRQLIMLRLWNASCSHNNII